MEREMGREFRRFSSEWEGGSKKDKRGWYIEGQGEDMFFNLLMGVYLSLMRFT